MTETNQMQKAMDRSPCRATDPVSPCALGELCCRQDIWQNALSGNFAFGTPLEQLFDYLEGAG